MGGLKNLFSKTEWRPEMNTTYLSLILALSSCVAIEQAQLQKSPAHNPRSISSTTIDEKYTKEKICDLASSCGFGQCQNTLTGYCIDTGDHCTPPSFSTDNEVLALPGESQGYTIYRNIAIRSHWYMTRSYPNPQDVWIYKDGKCSEYSANKNSRKSDAELRSFLYTHWLDSGNKAKLFRGGACSEGSIWHYLSLLHQKKITAQDFDELFKVFESWDKYLGEKHQSPTVVSEMISIIRNKNLEEIYAFYQTRKKDFVSLLGSSQFGRSRFNTGLVWTTPQEAAARIWAKDKCLMTFTPQNINPEEWYFGSEGIYLEISPETNEEKLKMLEETVLVEQVTN